MLREFSTPWFDYLISLLSTTFPFAPLPSVQLTGTLIDASLGNVFWKDLTVNEGYTFSNFTDGDAVCLILNNSSGADLVVSFPSTILFSGTPELTVQAGKESIFTFFKSNGKIYCTIVSRFTNTVPSVAGGEGRGAGRGYFAGGDDSLHEINYITIATLSAAQLVGTLGNLKAGGTASSKVRGLFIGGAVASITSQIQYISIPVSANAVNFGNMITSSNYSISGCSNEVRGVYSYMNNAATFSTLEYVTIATLGNGTNFGNFAGVQNRYGIYAASSPTRALFAGGTVGVTTSSSVIEYVEIATTGNAVNFGSLITARTDAATVTSPTRSVFIGGGAGDMEYVTTATLSNASVFGSLTGSPQPLNRGTSNGVRGVFHPYNSRIQTILIATLSSSSNFSASVYKNGNQYEYALSDSHGGIA